MKITLVIQDMFKLGAQYVTSLVARGLVARGYEIDLVVSKVHRDLVRQNPVVKPFEVPDKVNWVHLPFRKASCNVLAIVQYYKRNRPDIVISMSSNYDIACGLAMLICGRGRPLFMPVEHTSGIGLDLPCFRRSKTINGIVADYITRVICKIARMSIDRQLVVSNGVKTALVRTRSILPESIGIVYNPVIDDVFYMKKARQTQHPWLLNKECPVFVASGAHTAFKGHRVLLSAFRKVLDYKPCRLIIFGEGQLTEQYKKIIRELGIEDSVSLPGFTNNLPAELKSADAFVVSSQTESFSVVLVEALACGVRVISTNCEPGPPEILKNGKYGLMCEVDNPDDMASKMKQILDGGGIVPPQESWQSYTLDNVMDAYEREIREVICGRKSEK